jgi:hypothetical protein
MIGSMAAKLKWFDRKFNYTFVVDVYPDLIERVRGTPARVDEKVRGLGREVLTRRDGNPWSIQDNVGHLIDLDAVHHARIEDFLTGQPMLRAADPENRRTFEARYNDRPIDDVLKEFRAARSALVSALEGLKPADFAKVSRHPRLNMPMRLVDMIAFVGDHDDYHLARMTELLRMWSRAVI